VAQPRTALDLLASDEQRTARALVAGAIEQRSGLKSPEDWLINSLAGSPTSSGKRISADTAFNVITYYACVDLISKLVASLPVRLMEKTASGSFPVESHNAAWLLKDRPNNWQTPFEFKRYLMASVASRGNGYSRVFRDRYYEPTEVVPVHPADLQPEYVKKLRSVIYRGHEAAEAGQGYFLASDILHVRALSTDGVCGLSPLRVMRESLGLSLTYQEHTGATFANGGRMPGFITSDTIYTQAQIKDFLAAYKDSYGGADRAGKPRVLNGFKWVSIGMNNEDAELLASRKFEVEEIARFFGIPLHLLQSTEKSTTWGSGIEQLNRGVVDYMLAPWLVNLEQALNSTLLSEDDRRKRGMGFKVNVNALLRGDPKTRAEFYKVMREIAAMDPNQIRELEDFPLYQGEWADDPRAPFNGQGGGQADAASPQPSDATQPANA